MRVVEEVLAPGVQDCDHASLSTEMLVVGGDDAHRFGRRLEQDVVDDRFVLQTNRCYRRRHGEDDMVVGNW